MSELRPELKDRTVARLLSIGSAIGSYIPVVGEKVTQTDVPNKVPARWYPLRERADSIAEWVEFPGTDASGKTPRNYREAALININKAKLDNLRENFGGVHAVAYKLGTAAMVAIMQTRGRFEEDPEDSNYYQVAMGIGQGPLIATAGLWWREQQSLYVPENSLVDMGRRPVEELPPSVTLL
jgi:hypothetical protein